MCKTQDSEKNHFFVCYNCFQLLFIWARVEQREHFGARLLDNHTNPKSWSFSERFHGRSKDSLLPYCQGYCWNLVPALFYCFYWSFFFLFFPLCLIESEKQIERERGGEFVISLKFVKLSSHSHLVAGDLNLTSNNLYAPRWATSWAPTVINSRK